MNEATKTILRKFGIPGLAFAAVVYFSTSYLRHYYMSPDATVGDRATKSQADTGVKPAAPASSDQVTPVVVGAPPVGVPSAPTKATSTPVIVGDQTSSTPPPTTSVVPPTTVSIGAPSKSAGAAGLAEGVINVTPPEGSVLDRGPSDDAGKPTVSIQSKPSTPVIINPKATPTPSLDTVAVPAGLADQTPPISPPATSVQNPNASYIPPSGSYLFDNRRPDALLGSAILKANTSGKKSYDIEAFTPKGQDVDCITFGYIASNNYEIPIKAVVWLPYYFEGHKLLDTGDQLIGTASSGEKRGRIKLHYTTILRIRDKGKSIPCDIEALGMDYVDGVPGISVGNQLMSILEPLLTKAAESGINGFASTEQNQTTTATAFGTTTTTADSLKNNLINAGTGSTSSVFDTINQLLAQQAEDDAPYYVIKHGSRFKGRIMQPLDVSIGDYGL